MFRDFTELYNNKGQHDILVLVGNGFDIAVLEKYKKLDRKRKTSSYKDFYEYVQYFGLANVNNNIYRKMEDDRKNDKENWSDFENSISDLLQTGTVAVGDLSRDVDELREWFTLFLNDIVDSHLLLKLNDDAQEMKWSQHTLGRFLEDLGKAEVKFKKNFSDLSNGHYHILNYVFFNLNYTPLLDNYIYLDKTQFNPHPWKGSDTNFVFYNDVNGTQGVFQSYIFSDVIHVHGNQNTPRSILFGIDLESYNAGTDTRKDLVKGYWAQYEQKYQSYFETANLFIIYGMSLGEMDAWWFDQIYDAILNDEDNKKELIIYRRSRGDIKEESVKDRFLKSCVRHEKASQADNDKVRNNIHVVLFNNNDTHFLGLKDWNGVTP